MADALAGLPLVLTIPEAAQALRIGRTAAYSAARTGELRTVRLGRSLRVPRRAIAEMLGETDLGRENGAPPQGAAFKNHADAGGGDASD